jgi:hypothetical protein
MIVSLIKCRTAQSTRLKGPSAGRERNDHYGDLKRVPFRAPLPIPAGKTVNHLQEKNSSPVRPSLPRAAPATGSKKLRDKKRNPIALFRLRQIPASYCGAPSRCAFAQTVDRTKTFHVKSQFIGGGLKNKIARDIKVIFATIQTLAKRKDIVDQIDLFIIDECDEASFDHVQYGVI